MVRKEEIDNEEMSETTTTSYEGMTPKEMYEAMVSQRKVRSQGGVTLSAIEARTFLEDLMNAQNSDRLVFAAAAKVLSEMKGGKKMYNQLRSAVTSKVSGFILEKDEDGTLWVIRD